ncbi:MAG TPA: SpoIIE family protein phosphatase [Gemmataceae bacterium]|nr:SpoIIE family protein phosphatase [Gemmataceae bacterium]
MTVGQPKRVLLCADSANGSDEVRQLLCQAGYDVGYHVMNRSEPADPASANLIVLESSAAPDAARTWCQHLRGRLGEVFVPILLISPDADPRHRLASLECGADSYLLRPFEAGELLAQVRTFLRLKDRHDHLTEKSAEVQRINKRLQAAYLQIDQELELARRIQESFLPQNLPQLPQVRFAVHYQPCGKVGGDFYDVFRLDEHHIGFYVADAMGHGVPASLLTIFVKKGVRTKEIFGQQYRLVPPGEVLQRLNRDMIDQALSENPFITMVYVLFNQDGTLSFARSGHPYPLYIPREGKPVLWQIEGSLLGVFDTKYPVQTHQIQPGDKVLLYTDGMDAASFENSPVGIASLLAAADRYRDLGIDDLVDRLAADLFKEVRQTDDLTILGLEMSA